MFETPDDWVPQPGVNIFLKREDVIGDSGLPAFSLVATDSNNLDMYLNRKSVSSQASTYIDIGAVYDNWVTNIPKDKVYNIYTPDPNQWAPKGAGGMTKKEGSFSAK